MRFAILIFSVILNFACDPGKTGGEAHEAQGLKAEAQLLTQALGSELGRFDQELAIKKSSIEKAQEAYNKAGAEDYKTKGEQLLEARMAEALIADQMKELKDDKLKDLETQVKNALENNPDDPELKEADKLAKQLRLKFSQTQAQLAKIRAIRRELQEKEEALVKSFGAQADLTDLKKANEKVTKAKAKLDQAIQFLAKLNKPDALDQAIVDLKAAKTVDVLKQAALRASIPSSVIDQTLKAKNDDLKDLVKSLKKEVDSIKTELLNSYKLDITKTEKLIDSFEENLKDTVHLIKNDPDMKILKASLAKHANAVKSFTLSGFGIIWDATDKQNFLGLVKDFTDFFYPGSDPKLDELVETFQKTDSGNKGSLNDLMNQIKNWVYINMYGGVLKTLVNLEGTNIDLEAKKKQLENEKTLVDSRILFAFGSGPLDTIENIDKAVVQLIATLGNTYEARIKSLLAVDFGSQRDVLVKAAEVLKSDMATALKVAQMDKANANDEYNQAIADLDKLDIDAETALANKTAQKNIAKFLLGANINKLISLLNDPAKYNENAKLMNLIAQDLEARVQNRAELHRAFKAIDEPVVLLIQSLKQQKNHWSYKDPSNGFPKAMNYMIKALKTLLSKDQSAVEPVIGELILLQGNLKL